MKTLKELRNEKKLTQQQVAELVGVSIRSYKSYENDSKKKDTIKYRYIIDQLMKINPMDEAHGVLENIDIEEKCAKVFQKYDIHFCCLFGSYARHTATENSDVDLLISTKIKGVEFYGLVEEIRSVLNNKVNVVDVNQLKNNLELLKDIIMDGIIIYDNDKDGKYYTQWIKCKNIEETNQEKLPRPSKR
ncbi:nucleotidyltransferase domain-containing protein [Tannockella kyphosi]|uniref:nucleotidyltransferase domain-containing protein n=1 Tax=Tannockella kyphosi TaxID=2899121 RepID=UPI002011C9D5|nr:nucleotidyltransferase domain-containing protein [Tannockella kyphosi]